MTDDGWFRNERGNLCKRYGPPPTPVARGNFPTPMFSSDCMEPTEHIDGRHYSSKSQFRAVTKAHGMTEVGNERPRPVSKDVLRQQSKKARQEAVGKALAQSGL